MKTVKKSGTWGAFTDLMRLHCFIQSWALVTSYLSRNQSPCTQLPVLWARPGSFANTPCKYSSVAQAKGFAKMNECIAWVILRNLALIRFWTFNYNPNEPVGSRNACLHLSEFRECLNHLVKLSAQSKVNSLYTWVIKFPHTKVTSSFHLMLILI